MIKEYRYCACGCGKTRPRFNVNGCERKYITGHHMLGRKWSDGIKRKMSESKQGSKNHQWKNDDVGYIALHVWVRSHFWPTRLCQLCMEVPPYDLANITGIYNRDFKNWRYACRKCHVESDGRIFNLKHQNLRTTT